MSYVSNFSKQVWKFLSDTPHIELKYIRTDISDLLYGCQATRKQTRGIPCAKCTLITERQSKALSHYECNEHFSLVLRFGGGNHQEGGPQPNKCNPTHWLITPSLSVSNPSWLSLSRVLYIFWALLLPCVVSSFSPCFLHLWRAVFLCHLPR